MCLFISYGAHSFVSLSLSNIFMHILGHILNRLSNDQLIRSQYIHILIVTIVVVIVRDIMIICIMFKADKCFFFLFLMIIIGDFL